MKSLLKFLSYALLLAVTFMLTLSVPMGVIKNAEAGAYNIGIISGGMALVIAIGCFVLSYIFYAIAKNEKSWLHYTVFLCFLLLGIFNFFSLNSRAIWEWGLERSVRGYLDKESISALFMQELDRLKLDPELGQTVVSYEWKSLASAGEEPLEDSVFSELFRRYGSKGKRLYITPNGECYLLLDDGGGFTYPWGLVLSSPDFNEQQIPRPYTPEKTLSPGIHLFDLNN